MHIAKFIGLNIGKNCQLPNFIPHQYFVLYGIIASASSHPLVDIDIGLGLSL